MSRFAERFEKMSRGERAYALNMPIHFVRARALSTLEKVLTDCEFIQAKADNGLIHELVQDYALVQRTWPDEEEERRRKCHYETTMRYVEQLVAYSHNPEQNPFPVVPPAEIRIDQKDSSTGGEPNSAAEHVAYWGRFVGRYSEPIAKRAAPLFQMAYNSADSGPVVADIESRLCGGGIAKLPWLKVVNRSSCARDAGLVRVLWGVDRFTYSVVMDSPGRLAASGGDSGAISIWSLETGQLLRVLHGHSQSVTALATTPNMGRIISGSEDGSIRMWDAYEGKCLSVFDGGDGRVTSLAITPVGRMAVSCGANTVRVWDLARDECIACLVDHAVSALAITADGRRMILGGATNDDCSVYVYETHNLTQVSRLPGHEASVFCIAITPDGRRAVTGSYDQQVGVWDLGKPKCLGLYRQHDAFVRAIDITPDGRLAVSGSGDGSLRLWDLENMKTIALTGHMRPIDSLAVSVDGRRCASVSSEQGLYVWDLSSSDPSVIKAEEVSILTGTPNLKRRVQLTGKKTLSVSWEDRKHILCDRRRKIHAIERFVATSDISLGVSTHADNIVRFWNLADGELIQSLDYDQKPQVLYLIPGTTCILIVLEDWRMELRNLRDGACLKDRRLSHGVYKWAHSLTPDCRHLVLSDGNHSICFLDIETNSVSGVFQGHTEYVGGVEVSPDGRRMYSQSLDHTLRIWNLEDKSSICRAEEVAFQRNLTLSPDASCIAVGDGFDVRLVDSVSGDALHLLSGHKHLVGPIVFSPDGQFIITSASNSTMRIWNARTGQCIASHVSDSGDLSPRIIAWPYIIANTRRGKPLILRLENAPALSRPVISARRLWLYGEGDAPGAWDESLTLVCFYCGRSFRVNPEVIGCDVACPFEECGKELHVSSMAWDRRVQ